MGVVSNLKQKAIQDYLEFLTRLEKGYKDDYHNIINIINLIDLYGNIDNSEYIASWLLNH